MIITPEQESIQHLLKALRNVNTVIQVNDCELLVALKGYVREDDFEAFYAPALKAIGVNYQTGGVSRSYSSYYPSFAEQVIALANKCKPTIENYTDWAVFSEDYEKWLELSDKLVNVFYLKNSNLSK